MKIKLVGEELEEIKIKLIGSIVVRDWKFKTRTNTNIKQFNLPTSDIVEIIKNSSSHKDTTKESMGYGITIYTLISINVDITSVKYKMFKDWYIKIEDDKNEKKMKVVVISLHDEGQV